MSLSYKFVGDKNNNCYRSSYKLQPPGANCLATLPLANTKRDFRFRDERENQLDNTGRNWARFHNLPTVILGGAKQHENNVSHDQNEMQRAEMHLQQTLQNQGKCIHEKRFAAMNSLHSHSNDSPFQIRTFCSS